MKYLTTILTAPCFAACNQDHTPRGDFRLFECESAHEGADVWARTAAEALAFLAPYKGWFGARAVEKPVHAMEWRQAA